MSGLVAKGLSRRTYHNQERPDQVESIKILCLLLVGICFRKRTRLVYAYESILIRVDDAKNVSQDRNK